MAPQPIAFRLRGQDPLLILALGDLQWAWGVLLVCLLLPSSWSGSLVPRFVERDPSYPPLADSPSLPTPSWIGRMANRPEGGGRNLFLYLWLVDSFPFLPPGSCFVLLVCVCFVACDLVVFDSLRVLLGRVCLFVCLFSFFSLVFACKTLVFDPGVSGTVVGFPVRPWSCVLLVLRLALSVVLVFVALRRVVFSFFLLCFALPGLSCCLFLSGCAWGVLSFFQRVC